MLEVEEGTEKDHKPGNSAGYSVLWEMIQEMNLGSKARAKMQGSA